MNSKQTTHLNARNTAEWLKTRDNFLILTHRRPDGDTLGTAAGLCALLRCMGKTAFLLENPETTARYLKYVTNYIAPKNFTPETVITTDTADTLLLPSNAQRYIETIDLCIDHHASNKEYAAFTYLDTSAAACGELIFPLAEALDIEIDAEIATALYVAIATDTGCFQYANTTAKTFEIVSKLLAAGADYWAVNKKLFRTKSRARIALDGALFSDLQFFLDGKVAVCVITQALLAKCGATEDDLDDVATIPNQVEGVIVGVVVREVSAEYVKISLRTAPNTVSASDICQKFGGGGHPMAAGCVIKATPEAAVQQFVAAITAEIEAKG